MSEQEQTQEPQRTYPFGEPCQVTAKFYGAPLDEEPTFVQIDGATYRREDDQEEARLFLREEDLRMRLAKMVGPEVMKMLGELSDAEGDSHTHHLDTIMAHLVHSLPAHQPIIEHAIFPDMYPDVELGEWCRHMQCRLPRPRPEPEE